MNSITEKELSPLKHIKSYHNFCKNNTDVSQHIYKSDIMCEFKPYILLIVIWCTAFQQQLLVSRLHTRLGKYKVIFLITETGMIPGFLL